MYERFLPSFKVVEINNSTAHRIGHAISQVPAYSAAPAGKTYATVKATTFGDYKFIENGIIVGYGMDGLLSNYDATKHAQPCLVYNDELITGPINTLDKYAEEVEDGQPVYLRALPLYVGDSFTTNNFKGSAVDGYAKVEDGQLSVSGDSTDALFIAKKTTMPNGKVGVEFTYIGKVSA